MRGNEIKYRDTEGDGVCCMYTVEREKNGGGQKKRGGEMAGQQVGT